MSEKTSEVWFHDGLPQKSSFLISELFPGGPRHVLSLWKNLRAVTAAVTNSRSGVTVLFDGRRAYRFRWTRKTKRFSVCLLLFLTTLQLARNTPKDLPYNITITPKVA